MARDAGRERRPARARAALCQRGLAPLFVLIAALGAAAQNGVAQETPAGPETAPPASAQEPQDAAPASPEPKASEPEAEAKKAAIKIPIVLARELRPDVLPPLSLLDIAPPDDGIGGAKLAISDNNTTGKFLGQEFSLEILQSPSRDELVAEVQKRVDSGIGFIVADASADTLLAMADAIKGKDAIIFNASARDDVLRAEQCRANVLHTAPSRSMLADALGQYLAWKQWRNWVLISGDSAEDKATADAYRRAAQRFGHKIVEERVFKYDPGSRRSDGGFEQIQQQIPGFTQRLPNHHVVVIADASGLFGEYFPYRTWDARPVVGTAGLYPATWHPAIELWGGTQFQNRFKRMNGRTMRPLDYDVWAAVRAVGEAATRKNTADPKTLIAYVRSPEFELAAFKGQKVTFRGWDGQLREPILIVTGKVLVSVSPQAGFLHQFTELDTLGVDKPETKCKAYQ